ncbi:hypothetical protein AZA_31813 [Nitrospirillum viridazoti Y2]|nr:hypothetical protein AZA_31813 [Nitrospirillum amazonense Y2]
MKRESPFICSSCGGDEAIHSSQKPTTCVRCGQVFHDASFIAYGIGAMEAQAAIVTEHIRAGVQVRRSQNILAAVFIIVGGLFLLFAPAGRELAAEIISASFLIIGAGVAGFANLRVRTPHAEVSVSEQPSMAKRPRAMGPRPNKR